MHLADMLLEKFNGADARVALDEVIIGWAGGLDPAWLAWNDGTIPALAAHFSAAASRRNHWRPRTLAPDAITLLREQPWKGNVRELRNVVERVLILGDADPISAEDVRHALPGGAVAGASAGPAASSDGPLAVLVDQYERDVIRQRLKRLGGHVTNTARSLGLERSHLYKKCRHLGIDIREEG